MPRCCAALRDRCQQRRVLRAVRHDIEQRVEEERHVERQVGHQRVARHRRVAREVVGAQQAPLLGRHEQEQRRAPAPRRQRRGGMRDLEHDRHAGGVVVRAVVDVVAVHRDPAPEVIDMGDVDHVLGLQLGVAALDASDQVRAVDVLASAAGGERDARRQVERLRLARGRGGKDLGKRRRRTGKERRRAEWFSDADPRSAASPRLGCPCASTQAKLPCLLVATLTSQRKRGSSGEVKLIVPMAPRFTASASFTAPDE